MRQFILSLLLVALPLLGLTKPGLSQTPEQDRSYLQGLLEDNLSGAGRDVRIIGFQGALSSQARIAELTIADGQGIWLRLTDLVLDWNRAALLRGRIDVTELTVAQIDLIRPPVPDASLPTTEASAGFSLPELPVSVQIGRVAAERVSLGAAVIGQAIDISLEGSAALADGQGSAELAIDRIDGTRGRILLSGGYDNASRNLALDLAVEEQAGGILATLMGLPGGPSIRLVVTGDAPVDDFAADIALDTDDQERLSGQVTVQTLRDAATDGDAAADDEQITRRLVTRIGGDIAPLFAPEYRDFFGPDIQLAVTTTQTPDGRMLLDGLDLTADAIRLNGSAALAADGWPERMALEGRIAAANGRAVLLPLSGPQTRTDAVDLDLTFDASENDSWTLQLDIRGLDRPDLRAERAVLSGQGLIARGSGAEALGLVNGQINFVTQALRAADPGLEQALGGDVSGDLRFEWTPQNPFEISDLSLNVADTALTGKAQIAFGEGDTALSDLQADFDLTLIAADLSRFAILSGQPLAGAADLAARGAVQPLTGAFNIDLSGTAQDLEIGQPRIDPLITGNSDLALQAGRDPAGTRIDRFEIVTTGTDLRGRAALRSDDSQIDLTARLTDAALIVPELSGPIALTLGARQQAETWQITLETEAPGDTTARIIGTITGDGTEQLLAEGQISASMGNLSAWSRLAGRPLSGAGQLSLDISGDVLARSGAANGRLDGTNLSIGQANADALLRGASSLVFNLRQTAEGVSIVDQFELRTPQGTTDLTGRIANNDSQIDLTARLTDAAQVVPELSGPIALTLGARQSDDIWQIVLDADAPGDTTARIIGTITGDGTEQLLAEGQISASMGNLSAWSRLVGRPLSGAARLSLDVAGDVLARSGAANGRLDGTNLSIGQANADALLRGASSLVVNLRQTDQGMTILDLVELRTPQGVTDLTGRISANDSRIRFDASLRDIGLIAPELSGPAAATGVVQSQGGDWQIDATATGPGGITARTNGTVAADGQRVNLTLQGGAPLSLANERLRPNSVTGLLNYDLAVNGPPDLSSVSGVLSTNGARVVLPGAGLALGDLAANVRLSGGRAQIEAQAGLSSGGQIALSGPVTLSGAFPAELTATLRGATLSQRNLYETTADGQVTLNGPLTGGAQIGGTINLGTVELRIPESLGPTFANLPNLEHRGESAASRQTRLWAGMIADPNAAPAGPAVSYPIDLLINAPSRIFVRGRGLDAELGGRLRLTGTTADLIPQGQFDLVRGRFNILGKRLDLTQGLVSLQGAFDPYIRFIAETEAAGSAIRIGLEGLASEPELTLTSSPELPQDEVLALLLFGRSITDISALQAVQLAGAVRTLSGRGNGLSEGLRSSIGVDDLDLSTTDTGETEARVGKYISDNIYTDLTVNTAGETQINLNLNVSRSITVRGRLNSDGGTGIGIYIERDY